MSYCKCGPLDSAAWADSYRNKYDAMPDDSQDNEAQQCELLSAFAKIACGGSRCLKAPVFGSEKWKASICTLCDMPGMREQHFSPYWNEQGDDEDSKDAIAAMILITKESKFQNSPKARVLMAVAIGRVFNHISDVDYLNLEMCELGQWLLGSLSRSLRELKLASA
jgi:serine/threonine-protein kinase ATR